MVKDKESNEFKHGELREIVLSALSISLIVGGSIVFPNLPIIIGSIIKIIQDIKNIKLPERKLKRVLKNLERKQIICLVRKGDDVYVKIKDKTNISLIKYSIRQLLELKKKKKVWNGKWFLVLFDIPEEQRNKRNYLRKFLRDIGFFQYQQSVYIFPYECEKEVELIKKIIESAKYMSYVVAEKIEHENEAKIFFQL